jgi:biopolymer transport protein ExbD
MDDQPGTLSESQLKAALAKVAAKNGKEKTPPVIRIEADATSSHQTVVTAMDAAAAQGLNRISIVTSHH